MLNVIMEPDFNPGNPERKMTLLRMGLIEPDEAGALPLYRYCHTLENGKVNLSIKRLQSREAAPRRDNRPSGEGRPQANRPARPAEVTPPPAPKTADQLFEEKLKAFMAESDSKIASCKQYDRPRGRRR